MNNARGSIFMALVLHGTNNAVGMLIKGGGPMFSTPGVNILGDMLLAVCALLIIIFTGAASPTRRAWDCSG